MIPAANTDHSTADQGPSTVSPEASGVLSPLEMSAWIGFMHAHAALTAQLEADLTAERMTLSGFEALYRVARTEQGRLGLSALCRLVRLSPSGVTRLVDRLQREKALERFAATADARSVEVTITEIGRERLAKASAVLFASVREHFVAHFSAEELGHMTDFWERLNPGACD